MKILMTGVTRTQCEVVTGHDRYWTLFGLYRRALEMRGHTVEQRRAVPGEPLRGNYDAAFVGLHALGSMTATSYKLGALWAAHELPYTLALMDWKVKVTMQHLRSSEYTWNTLLVDKSNGKYLAEAKPFVKQLESVRDRWAFRIDNILAPVFPWVDQKRLESMHPAKNWLGWDASPIYRLVASTFLDVRPKKKQWALVSLSDVSEWKKKNPTTWPLVGDYPTRDTKGGASKKWNFTPEDELLRGAFAESQGILLPGYGKQSVAGWWRSRFAVAASCGAILCGDREDLDPVYGPGFSLSAKQIEELDTLDEMAKAQAAEFERTQVAVDASAVALEALSIGMLNPAMGT